MNDRGSAVFCLNICSLLSKISYSCIHFTAVAAVADTSAAAAPAEKKEEKKKEESENESDDDMGFGKCVLLHVIL